MAANTRTAMERQRDLVTTLNLYLRGLSQYEIAAQIGVSREQIKYDLADIRAEWAANRTLNMDEAKTVELARIDHLERTYWDAYDRSLQEKVDTRQEQTTWTDTEPLTEAERKRGKKPKTSEHKTTKGVVDRTQMLGNMQALQGVQWCISERCRILGLYAPSNVVIDWRREAALLGLDTDLVFEQLTDQLLTLIPTSAQSTPG